MTNRTIFTKRLPLETFFSTKAHTNTHYDEGIKRWQYSTRTFVAPRYKQALSKISVIAIIGISVSCGASGADLCSQAVSVPSFSTRFAQGLDNFSEDQYENLRIDAGRSRETVIQVLELYPADSSLVVFLGLIDDFILAMEESQWDVSVALSDQNAVLAAQVLGETNSIIMANQVDSYVIDLCGLPATFVPNLETGSTLPMPWIAGPTDTEPDSELIMDESEFYARGEMVATLFQLTLSQQEVLCLGTQLANIIDRSDATSNSAQYQEQFQIAFDNCAISFTVPVD